MGTCSLCLQEWPWFECHIVGVTLICPNCYEELQEEVEFGRFRTLKMEAQQGLLGGPRDGLSEDAKLDYLKALTKGVRDG